MANMRPADTAASKTKQAFALRFPIAVRTGMPYVPFLPLRNARFAPQGLFPSVLLTVCGLTLTSVDLFFHERKPFSS